MPESAVGWRDATLRGGIAIKAARNSAFRMASSQISRIQLALRAVQRGTRMPECQLNYLFLPSFPLPAVQPIIGAAATLFLAKFRTQSPLAVLVPVMLIGVSAGLTGPAAINDVTFAEAGLAATATSLAGAFQMLASSASMSVLRTFTPLGADRVAWALIVSTVIGLICAMMRRSVVAEDPAAFDRSSQPR